MTLRTYLLVLGLALACADKSTGDDEPDQTAGPGVETSASGGGGSGGSGGGESGGSGGGESGGSGGGESGGSGGGESGGGESGGGESGGSGTTQTTAVEALPVCVQSCASSEDCDLGSAPFDTDNYACEAGACVWTGCNSSTECDRMTSGWVCHEGSAGVAYCAPGCSTASDCDQGVDAYDRDNYTCTDGACVYSGCNTNAECADLSPGYVCAEHGDGLAYCTPGCSDSSDCDMGLLAYDSDNYSCSDGGCIYTGCNSDAECQELDRNNVCH